MEINLRLQRMETEKMLPLIVSFSLPSIISMTAMALYNVVDTIFVGRLGTNAIAGLTLIMPLQLFLMAFGLLIGTGATSYIARSLGAKQYAEANHAFSSSIMLGAVVSVLQLLLALVFLEPLLQIIGRRSDAIPQALEYGYVIIFGIPSFVFNMILTQIARAEGNPNIAMTSQLVGALLNALLDPLFIFTFKLGIKGAAIATILSSFISLLIIGSYFWGPKSHLTFDFKYLMPTKKIMSEMGKSGFPSFTRHLAASFVAMLTNTMLAGYGAFALAIMGINNRFIMIFFMPMIGTALGFLPIAGYNFGAQNYRRVKDAFWKATIVVSIFCVSGWLLVQLFPELCLRLFSSDPVVIAQGKSSLRIINIFLPLVGFQIIGANLYQAIGNGLAGFILSLARQVIIFLPVVVILKIWFGLQGIFLSFFIADLLAGVITALWLLYTFKKFDRSQQPALVAY